MTLALKAFSFAPGQPSGNSDHESVIFDIDFLQLYPLTLPLTEKVYVEIISPLYHKKIAWALSHGAATVLAKTQAGGYTGDPRQVDHIVSYALYGLNRLLDSHSEAKPHLVKFDSYRLSNARPIRSTSSLRKRQGQRQLPSTSRDSIITDRIQTTFVFAARHIRRTLVDSIGDPYASLPGWSEWDFPLSVQTADRGCALHAIVNAKIALAVRSDMIRVLDTVVAAEQQNPTDDSVRNRLFDVDIPILFQRYLWGPGTHLPELGNFYWNSLLEDTERDQPSHLSKPGFPSWYDLALYQAVTYAIYIAVCGIDVTLPTEYDNFGDMLIRLQEIAEDVYELQHETTQGKSNTYCDDSIRGWDSDEEAPRSSYPVEGSSFDAVPTLQSDFTSGQKRASTHQMDDMGVVEDPSVSRYCHTCSQDFRYPGILLRHNRLRQ